MFESNCGGREGGWEEVGEKDGEGDMETIWGTTGEEGESVREKERERSPAVRGGNMNLNSS